MKLLLIRQRCGAMVDVLLNWVFLCIALLLAIAGAVIAGVMQHRSWAHQARVAHRNSQRDAALLLVQEIAPLIDKRLHRQRRFLWAVRSRDPARISEAQAEYRAAVDDWAGSFGGIKAGLMFYFSRWNMLQFEDDIHNAFRRAGSIIEQFSAGSANREDLARAERDLDRLGRSSYEFVHSLIKMVETDEISDLQKYKHVSFENWEFMTTSYLTRRLFGLAGE